MINKPIVRPRIMSDAFSRNMAMPGNKESMRSAGHENFSSKELRDVRFSELKEMGEDIEKTSISNQQLDPRYVEDSGHKEDLGLGNERYYYKKLYGVKRI